MTIPLGAPSDPVEKEWKVPSRYWENVPLPNTVAPSFDTCNLSRTYELEVRVGLSHGGREAPIKPELIVLPLRLPVKVYSGIAPPPALLQRIATSHPKLPGSHLAATAAGGAPPTPLSPASFYPPTPMTPSYAQHHLPAPPGTTASYFQSSHRPPQTPDGVDDDEAPPSYEDAMADEMAPVDGPRRDYNIPTAPPDRRDSGFGVDSKGGSGGGGHGGSGGLGRRVSERLFPQNGTGAGAAMGIGGASGRGSRPSSGESEGEGNAGAGAAGVVAGGGGGGHDPAGQQQRLARKPTLPPSFEESTNNSSERDGR
jgi:hypothetical protein